MDWQANATHQLVALSVRHRAAADLDSGARAICCQATKRVGTGQCKQVEGAGCHVCEAYGYLPLPVKVVDAVSVLCVCELKGVPTAFRQVL